MDRDPNFDEPTPALLINEVAATGSDAGWQRLVYLYEPFLRGRLRRYGLQDSDEADLIQDVFTVVHRRLPDFHHNGRTGAFRTWLRKIVGHNMQQFHQRRTRQPALELGQWAAQMADESSLMSHEWDREHDRHVAWRLLELVRAEFNNNDYEAFRRTALDDEPICEVAVSLKMELNQVYLARNRILSRLRAIGRGVLSDE